jgi:hypothetical protein
MATIQIEVSDEVLAKLGTVALTDRLRRLVAWEELQDEAKLIGAAMDEAGLDNDALMKEASARAWEKYKYLIKDKLPSSAFDR